MRLRKCMVIVLAIAVLGSNSTITFAENDVINQVSEESHKHIYVCWRDRYKAYGSNLGTSHPYISGYEVNPRTMKLKPVYGTCYTAVINRRVAFACDCGEQIGECYKNIEVHSACRK